MRGIKEHEALLVLMQICQSGMSMMFAASIGLAIGLFIVPFFALSSSLNLCPEIFGLKERLVCFAITLMSLVGAAYCTNKTIYFGALLRRIFIRLEVIDKGKSLIEYTVELKEELLNKNPIFKKYKMAAQFKETELKRSYELQVFECNAGAMLVALILFSFIWWGTGHFFWYLLGSELIYGLSIWLLFRYIPIT